MKLLLTGGMEEVDTILSKEKENFLHFEKGEAAGLSRFTPSD